MNLMKHAKAAERLLAAERDLAAHRVMFESIDASPSFLARLAASEREMIRLQADNEELRQELTRRDRPARRHLRVV